MHKLIRLVKRREGLDPHAFHGLWLATARSTATSGERGLVRCRQSHALERIYAKREPGFDGFSEEWYDSRAARDAACDNAFDASAMADLLDESRTVVLPVEVDVILDGPALDTAVISAECIRRRPDLTPAEFDRYWRDRHGPLACQIPFQRYEQNHLARDAEKAGPLPFQGVAVVWFASTDVMRSLPGSPAHRAIREDEANFLEGESLAILARSHSVL